ncbi:alpha/beta hydrolase [Emcibacter nanhaiensis]|uniref:Alpha/beta hydrolase n=1 Tax=Emcibacter nanhaiensis TaxID=1505037 RepID=A0A501PD81_9PROT|nr:alpha/beta hydrolase-fold protein [Emcibacter nanhaiensis]TPD57916.1 alpha/beta hydrolase [Emcibacter nanhaiensis]
MNRLIFILYAFFASATAQAAPGAPATEAGRLDLATKYHIASAALGDERTILISVPDGYDASDARYPVIYLLDGMQSIYHAAGTRDVLVRSGDMPPVILVGLKSVNRTRDMTPSRMAGNAQSGGAAKLLAHLRDEVIPFVEKAYRANGYRVLTGHSDGGLFSVYALMEAPKLFDAEIIMSPALWWNGEEMTKAAGPFLDTHPKLTKSLYFGIGADDGDGMRQELKRFVDVVKAAQLPGVRWDYREFDGEGHMSAPLRTFYHGVKFIFADLRLPDEVIYHFTTDAFLAHERMIQAKYGAAARQTQELYVPLGLHLIETGDYDGAIAVLQRNAEAYAGNRYPRNNAWLADAYQKAGRKAEALAEYQRAYRLAVETGYGEADSYRQKIVELGGHAD